MNQERPKIHFVRYAQKSKKDARLVSRFSLFLLVFVFAVSLALSAYPIHASAEGEGGVQSALRARIERAEFASLFAGIFDSIGNFFRRFATNRKAEESIVDGQAIREKNRQIAALFTGAETLVDVNAESRFKGSAGFSKDVSVEGLLRGTEIDLGTGKITAGNIIYEVIGGDGILVSGDRQRPVVSQLFWMRRGNSIVTRDPGLSLEIQGELIVGTPDSSRLTFNGPALISFLKGATTTIPAGTSTAWTIAASATGTPIVSVSANNGGTVGVGTTSSSAKFSIDDSFRVATSSAGINIFEIFGRGGIPFFIVDSEGRVGVATASPSSFFSVDGNALFAGSTTFAGPVLAQSTSTFAGTIYGNGSAYFAIDGGRVGVGTKNPSNTFTIAGTFGVSGDAKFGTSPIIPIVSCEGQGVLETDGSGRITCGSDAVGSAGGSGTVSGSDEGNIAYYAGGTKVIGSSNLVFREGTVRFGVGTSSPATTTSVVGDIYLTGGLGVGRATGTPGVIETTGVINVQGAGTSSFTNGINLSSGCYAVNSNCAVTGSGGGTFNPGTANRLTYYSSATTLDSANFLTTDITNSRLGIGTSTPGGVLSVSASSTVPTAIFRQATSTNSGSILSFISGTSDNYAQEIGNIKGLNPTIKGSVTDATNLDGAISVYVSGRYAYLAAQTADRLTIVDVSNPASPTTVGSVTDAQLDTANAVYVTGNYAYVAASGNADRLTIVDVSNPSSPAIVGSVTSTQLDGARSVYVSGRYAYVVAETADGLTIVDVSNPSSPAIVGSVTSTQLDSAYSVYVSGRYAYVAAGGADRLTIVDVSNPSSPVIVGSVTDSTLLDVARSVYVSGRYAYVMAWAADSLTIVDVFNPSSPTIVGSVTSALLDDAHYIYVSGRYAYVTAANADRLIIVDVSSPASPVIVGSVTDAQLDYASAVYVSGRYAYVAAYNADRLTIVELPGLDIPTVLTGDIQTGSLETWENIDVGNDLLVRGGASIGGGGLYSSGPGSFSTFATTSLLNIPALSGSITDSNLSSVVDILKLTHMASSTAASGIGTGLLFSAENTSGTTTDIARISSIFTNAGGSATTSVLTFSTLSEFTLSEKMRINENGFVGIGTTTPGSLLNLYGTSSILTIQSYVNSANAFQILNAATTSMFTVDTVNGSTTVLGILNSGGFITGNATSIHATGTTLYVGSGGILTAASSSILNLTILNSTTTRATTSYLAVTTHASTSYLTVSNSLGVGRSTTTYGNAELAGIINVQGTGTSSFSNGINLADGCFATRGVCAALGGTTINSGTANRLAYYSGASTLDSANYLTTDATNFRLTWNRYYQPRHHLLCCRKHLS
ncbi:MAG: PKD domain containing protein [Parcubacteria group bacterium GW2011_GWA1_53_13]|nr:MAG: PKD domain containing protein [Parcubacteria group bacterium GW2011_GWA1_53_13]